MKIDLNRIFGMTKHELLPLSPFSFAHNSSDLERYERLKKQYNERGFDDTELMNLDRTFAAFMLPRLKAFRDFTKSCPARLTEKEWKDILDQIIWSLDFVVSEDYYETLDRADWEKCKKGISLLAVWFLDLWS